MKKVIIQQLIFLLILSFTICLLLETLLFSKQNSIDSPQYLDIDKIAAFNITDSSLHHIKQYCAENQLDFIEFFSAYMTFNDYEVDSLTYDYNRNYYQNVTYPKSLKKIYEAILLDLRVFPIPELESEDLFWYLNTWEAERTYGGDRKHYGTDIMDTHNTRGMIPIVSMTDGKVEKVGWLELGGWRIGIRTKRGAYFYYAHLERFEESIHKGAKVKAGQIIGYMGNSGYGEEGTTGKFPVHLHLGISLQIDKKETWINPYWILKYIQNEQVKL